GNWTGTRASGTKLWSAVAEKAGTRRPAGMMQHPCDSRPLPGRVVDDNTCVTEPVTLWPFTSPAAAAAGQYSGLGTFVRRRRSGAAGKSLAAPMSSAKSGSNGRCPGQGHQADFQHERAPASFPLAGVELPVV